VKHDEIGVQPLGADRDVVPAEVVVLELPLDALHRRHRPDHRRPQAHEPPALDRIDLL
jgi:hypothetical protein